MKRSSFLKSIGAMLGGVSILPALAIKEAAKPIVLSSYSDLPGPEYNGQEALVLNETGKDIDVRIEGNTDGNLLSLDADTEAAGYVRVDIRDDSINGVDNETWWQPIYSLK